MPVADDSIADVATHLHGLLQSKEADLTQREADFERRVALFEAENPSAGSDSDVIRLNVGGSAVVAVHRRTLTQCEDSALAARFSGRWDDSLERDPDGNVFVDQEPDDFLLLVRCLRRKMNHRPRPIPACHLPTPTFSFCSMLEYYGLMPAVYLQTWSGTHTFRCEEKSYGTIELSVDTDNSEFAAALCDFGAFKEAGVSEFTVEFEPDTEGAVGWFSAPDSGNKGVGSCASLVLPVDGTRGNSLLFSTTERKIFGPGVVLADNMQIGHTAPIKITCTHDGHQEYSIEVVNASPSSYEATTTLAKKRYLGKGSDYARVFPMVSFNNKVTVSGLKYAIDQL